MKLRLQPIRVFCIHHVSDKFDPLIMWDCDWVNTEALKQWVKGMQHDGYQFISLLEANQCLKHDYFRSHRYAVLTADDGFKTLLNILPWLMEQHIPITLFVNPKYILEQAIGPNVQEKLDTMHHKATSDELYLKMKDILALNNPMITYANHGYEHLDELQISKSVFDQNVSLGIDAMKESFPNRVPFFAHTFGHTVRGYDQLLYSKGETPVYVSGSANYQNAHYIDREVINNDKLPYTK